MAHVISHKKMCQRLEVLHNSECFPNDFVTSRMGKKQQQNQKPKKKPFEVQDGPMDFNIKWYETLIDRVSESTLQLTFTQLACTEFGVRVSVITWIKTPFPSLTPCGMLCLPRV